MLKNELSIKKIIIICISVFSVTLIFILLHLQSLADQESVASTIKGVKTFGCGAASDVATFVDAKGFVNISHIYNGTLPFYDFVLKPGNKGSITMILNFSRQEICRYGHCMELNSTQDVLTYGRQTNFTKFFSLSNRDILKTYQKFPLIPYNTTDIRLNEEAENLTANSVRITYSIEVSPTADLGNYLLTFYNTCPGELLTVGDKPYRGPLPWDHGRIM